MGTVGYLSPEQVRGLAADHRSDIFSFGEVLHEMLSGQRAFQGQEAVEVMNAILKEVPLELTRTNPNIAPTLEPIVRRRLEKSPEQRFQTGSDLAFALEPQGSRLACRVSGEFRVQALACFPRESNLKVEF